MFDILLEKGRGDIGVLWVEPVYGSGQSEIVAQETSATRSRSRQV